MRLYRLLNQAHDSVAVGSTLSRPSRHSNQKMGNGMYFGLSDSEARRFNATNHGHSYTHLVEVDVPFTLDQFFDLRGNPNAIVKSRFVSIQNVDHRHNAFCDQHNVVGLIWQSTGSNGWTEAVVLSKHIGTGFTITGSALV